MNPITLFLELKIEALTRGRENAGHALEYLTSLINAVQGQKHYYIFIDEVSAVPQPRSRIAKVTEDCFQLFCLEKEGYPRLIKILIFFQNKIYDNFLIRLDDERNLCEIEDIQMQDISDRGIGSVCLKNLEKVLHHSTKVNRIIAGIAPRDYERRKHLYHFYRDKNGYRIKTAVTRNSWGLVEKILPKDS
ncbi:hypothetical protein [Paradesulfitobacterium ferrireducens]|uniref:hypothetical protein n=1 Tax=Paradesulfitobacterium ferrireducens TaxID=2816476 RepID=UPI001A8FAE92|nr:hypothetical protein [Paradesulfitobacterium ferrireducens]